MEVNCGNEKLLAKIQFNRALKSQLEIPSSIFVQPEETFGVTGVVQSKTKAQFYISSLVTQGQFQLQIKANCIAKLFSCGITSALVLQLWWINGTDGVFIGALSA